MGVVIVQPYPVPESKSGSQTVEMLQKRLEAMGAIKSGNFCIDCETYATAHMTPPRAAHIIRNTEQPATCFAMMDSGVCLVADVLFETLMNKLSGIYTAKKASKIESKGQRYEVEDILVKIGSVSIGPSFKGILIEVEYQPCVIPANCFDLLKEFMQGFLGNVLLSPPLYMQNRMTQIYTPTDTVHQYMEHFNNFRKQTVAGSSLMGM